MLFITVMAKNVCMMLQQSF